jgi:hypothetical protein
VFGGNFLLLFGNVLTGGRLKNKIGFSDDLCLKSEHLKEYGR